MLIIRDEEANFFEAADDYNYCIFVPYNTNNDKKMTAILLKKTTK